MIFALASALRLARFNVMVDEEKPKWQGNFFTGMPTPAAAIVVLLPVYVQHLGIIDVSSPWVMKVVAFYALAIAFLMVSTIPTYSGKLMGERIGPRIRAAHLRPRDGLRRAPADISVRDEAVTLIYLACIPVSWSRYRHQLKAMPVAPVPGSNPGIDGDRVVGIRPTDKR